jgi:Flp pilus assembly protein TadG
MTSFNDLEGRRASRRGLVKHIRRLVGDRSGQVAIIFAMLVPVFAILIAGGIDASFAVNARTALQDASDEASLAASIAAAQNPNLTEAQLQTVSTNSLTANFNSSTPTITEFHVCSPVINDCTASTGPMQMGTVFLASSAPATCLFASLLPTFCVGGSTQTVASDSVTNIAFGTTVQLNVVMDSSASMIVGATPADVTAISNWVLANWNQVKPGDPAPYTGGDNPPCAFACHDLGGSTTPADIAMGLTNANAAGATTRFDVMVAAAQALINHVQTEATNNSQNRTNTYLFNIMSFDTTLHQYGATNISTFPGALTAVGQVTPGLDTYLDNAMTTLVTQVGTNGNGTSTASPLKFVILVTDGLQSDRNNNWNCSYWAMDPAWSWNTCYGGYASPINTALCTQMKNNGIVLAVLETPYVPLTGQDPNVSPYENTVRHVIYPNGPNTASTVSAALQACATQGYYFQAVNSSDIATGFTQLTDQFLARSSLLVK